MDGDGKRDGATINNESGQYRSVFHRVAGDCSIKRGNCTRENNGIPI